MSCDDVAFLACSLLATGGCVLVLVASNIISDVPASAAVAGDVASESLDPRHLLHSTTVLRTH